MVNRDAMVSDKFQIYEGNEGKQLKDAIYYVEEEKEEQSCDQ